MEIPRPTSSVLVTPNMVESQPDPPKSMNFYMDPLSKRDIFNYAPIDMKEQSHEMMSPSLPAYLRIVGILMSTPSEIVIEDTQAHKTYFLKEGEVAEPFQIFSLKDGKLVLAYQGQSFEVNLRQ